MKILFIVPSYKPAYIYGGPIVVIARLAERLVQLGHSVTVYTTTANGKTELQVPVGETVMVNGVAVKYFKRITKDHTHVSPALYRATWKTVRDFDVVHIHSWWNFLVIGAAMVCRMRGVKPVLSPHGMFCDYVLTANNSKKKQLIHNTIGKGLLKNTFLHVSSHMEWQESIQYNPKWKDDGAMVFNLVDLPVKDYARKSNHVFTISFLSRIDPKKGLEILLYALARVRFNYRLRIAGSGEDEYVQKLQLLVQELDMDDKVEWAGWKGPEEKFQFFAESDLFVLTSLNENFAIVVVESLYVGTPVLISSNVGLSKYVNERNLGWITGIDNIDEVAEKLTATYHAQEERSRISREARNVINNDFNETKLALDYVELYENSK